MIKDLISLAFPNNCIGCREVLLKGENFVCLKCTMQIPFCDNYAFTPSDWLTSKSSGLEALFFYDKKGITQSIIHEIKYKDNIKLAHYLGTVLGVKLKEKNIVFDCVIPVPLHKKRQKQRGYNQAEEIAKGIRESTGMPVLTNTLLRTKHTNTQTNKDKKLREENIFDAFEINSNAIFTTKNILLVDDVITTGATINECLKVLNKIKSVNVFVVSLGIVKI